MLAFRVAVMSAAFAVVAAASFVGATSARAGSPTTSISIDGGGNLVPGGAIMVPEFHMGFLLDDAARLASVPAGSTQNLEITMTAPNNAVFRFLFSPRPQFGIGYDPISGTNRAYAALTWNLFREDAVYGNFGLASSFDPAIGGSYTDPLHRPAFAPLMFHGALEFGYRFGGQNSLSVAVDQGVIPIARGTGAEPVENFSLRYGLKF